MPQVFPIGGVKRVLAVRLDNGDDLLDSLKMVAVKEGIETGVFFGIGVLTRAVYSPEPNMSKPETKESPLELISLIGDVTTIVDDEGKPIDKRVHGHINIGNLDGTIGGDVKEGTRVKSGEFFVFETDGVITQWKQL